MRDVVGTSCVLRIGDKYRVDKKLNGKNYYFGTYPTLIMALMVRDELISKGWPLSEVKHPCNSEKYISCLKGKFIIEKEIKGYNYNFGQFKTLKSALDERDKLIMCGWDYDAMESLDERVDGEIIWLGSKVYV
jgi:hypothetical protein